MSWERIKNEMPPSHTCELPSPEEAWRAGAGSRYRCVDCGRLWRVDEAEAAIVDGETVYSARWSERKWHRRRGSMQGAQV